MQARYFIFRVGREQGDNTDVGRERKKFNCERVGEKGKADEMNQFQCPWFAFNDSSLIENSHRIGLRAIVR